jgi:hypothetical protein
MISTSKFLGSQYPDRIAHLTPRTPPKARIADSTPKRQKTRPIGAGLLCARTNQERCRYTLKDEPQPQVDFTWGLSNLNPAASNVST